MSNREPSPVFLHTESKFIEEFNKTFTEKLIIQDLNQFILEAYDTFTLVISLNSSSIFILSSSKS